MPTFSGMPSSCSTLGGVAFGATGGAGLELHVVVVAGGYSARCVVPRHARGGLVDTAELQVKTLEG